MWQPSGLEELLIKCCGCKISETWFAGVVLVIAGNSDYVIVIYWSFSYSTFLTILEYLQGSVQICTDLHRNFFKTSNKRCFFRRALFIQLIPFSKTEFMTIQFSNNPGISVRICTDLYRSLQIHTECSAWALHDVEIMSLRK